MKWMDEDKYVWVVLVLTAMFFAFQFVRAGLRWFLE
jgi:hypothetical protein